MNWPGFSALGAAWLFALLVPLIVFYFLKLRRPRQSVSSLALWQQVINDQRVNSPFQKFKRNLLLLLQILMLCAVVLAAMQPYWPAGSDVSPAVPVLIDVSASMGASDRPGGPTRLDLAKDEVRRLIDNRRPDQKLSLIAVDRTARRLTDFTDNQRLLHQALDQLTVQPLPSRLEDGLRMAEALARTASVRNVVLVSDGNVAENIEFELPFQLNYQTVPQGGTNVGITEFNARRSEKGWDLFVRLEASEGSAKEAAASAARLVEVELRDADGATLQQESVSLEPGKSARLTFPLETSVAQSLDVLIRPDGHDALPLDNQAAIDLPPRRPVRVWCAASLESYRQALLTLPYVELVESATIPADLAFVDETTEGSLESPVVVQVGVIPEDLRALVHMESRLASVVDWDRTSPLLRHVQLLDVQISDDPVSAEGIGERDYELAGYDIIAQGTQGPLIVQKTTAGQLRIALLFHTDRSSLPYRVGFPILITNCVQIAMDRAELGQVRSWPTGDVPPRRVVAETTYDVTTPGGTHEALQSEASGLLAGLPAQQIGHYQIAPKTLTGVGEVIATYGTALLAPRETSLATVPKLTFTETSVSQANAAVAVDHPFWDWLAAGALIILLLEWWYFQRKPY